ncbi:hypothetical protein SAMN05443582_10813 [Phyllobacterium sp. OV277]|nr:hypothetical protein SAMN05443582_10813 [Phyllobacterium sp. OV277]
MANKPKILEFGSNLAGRHGKGAALLARQKHGAIYGQGTGLQGSSDRAPVWSATIKIIGYGKPACRICTYSDSITLSDAADFVHQYCA